MTLYASRAASNSKSAKTRLAYAAKFEAAVKDLQALAKGG